MIRNIKFLIGFIVMTIISNQSLKSEEVIELYASPLGKGAICSKISPGSLVSCREKVKSLNKTMKSDIVVYLRGGTYVLDTPFLLTSEDSGSNGFNVIYKAFPSEIPIISGGKTITGWSKFDETKNIYRASVGTTLNTRQLYVNGLRATRARGPQNPAGFALTKTGFTTADTSLEKWNNINDMEVVSFYMWKMFRMGVESIKGAEITIKQPCWKNSLVHDSFTPKNVGWLENAYELLTDEGEWYLDRAKGFLYYKPRISLSENMDQIEIVAPVLETLIQGVGTSTAMVQNIQFVGITFSYATWLNPSTNIGYADIQSGTHIIDADKDLGSAEARPTPGNITFTASRNILFMNNTFTRLGAVALEFSHGCIDNKIIGNRFQDISGSAIQIGGLNNIKAKWSKISDEAWTLPKNNIIQNNLITTIGADYYDACGIIAFYTDGTIIEHNEIYNVPYSGISVGWGWNNTKTTAGNNKIRYNHIHHLMQTMVDGGGIYTLSAQPGTEISYNYIHHQNNEYGMLYPDEGSSYMHLHHNVTASGTRWLHMWTGTVSNDKVEFNFHDTDTATLNATLSVVENNPLIKDGAWPKEALDIMKAAGLEAAFKYMLPAENLALKGAASASSTYAADHSAAKIIDDSLSGWSPTGADPLPWVILDLGRAFVIEKIVLVTRQDMDQPDTRKNFELQVSNAADFSTFKSLIKKDDSGLPFQATLSFNVTDTTPYRYVRAIKTKQEYFFITELKVFGKEK